jgi:transketolase
MEMRKIFASCLKKAMEENEKIVVLDADLGRANGTLELHKLYPKRAFDVGIAEQNMASVAAGLSSYGYIPFISSFTAFATRRICDQLTISGSYARSNIKVVGTDPGITAELNGGTHMSVEDIGVLRSIPGMVIFEPVDGVQLEKAMPQIINYRGMLYMRLFRKERKPIFDESYQFDLFKADILREGHDVTILATGIMLQTALEAVEQLTEQGIDAEVVNVHTIKPIDGETVAASAKKTGCVVTCENHNIIGGLYSAAAEYLSVHCPVPIRAIGIPDIFGEVGRLRELEAKMHMTVSDIIAAVKEVMRQKTVINK